MYEVLTQGNGIEYEIPNVSFPAYEKYKQQALELSHYVAGVQVSQETIKGAKSILADVREVSNRLNRIRIDMKKELLRNYEVVEAQIKEITQIVDVADQELRSKVKLLEERERTEKKEKLLDLWNKRIIQYPDIEELMKDGFNQWIQPKFLNKTFSFKAAETDMSKWMEVTQREIDTARTMGEEFLIEYICTGDLPKAIQSVKMKADIMNDIKRNEEDVPEEPTSMFIITGTKDITLTEMLLKENHINYTKKGI